MNGYLALIKEQRNENDNLQQEIKRLKEEYMTLQNASDEVEEEKDREIERLNNIINELEKYLEETKGVYEEYTCAIRKLKELKGVDKE